MFAVSYLTFVFVAQLAASDPSLRTDDFISLSCTPQGECFFLDEVGNLFFSPDRGKTMQRRTSLANIGPKMVRFSGLTRGWLLDASGRLWLTENGGRTFAPCRECRGLPSQERFSALSLSPPAFGLWLGSEQGKLFRGQRETPSGAVRFEQVHAFGDRRLEQVLPLANGGLVVLDGDGFVHSRSVGELQWQRSRPTQGKTVALLADGQDRLLAGACKGALAWSADQGRSWKSVPITGAGLSGLCLRPLGALGQSRMLVAGPPGKWVLVDTEKVEAQVIDSGVPIRIQAGQAVADVLVAAGQGGARATLRPGVDGVPRGTWFQKVLPATTDLRLFGKRGAVRVKASGSIELSSDSGAHWQTLNSPGAGTRRAVFVDKNHGFALVGRHELHTTRNGGQSWRMLGRWMDLALFDLSFVDDRTGWLVGSSGAVLRTVDGGENWTLDKLPADNHDLNRVLFVDRKRGWTVGAHQIAFRTRDGGKSWSRQLHGRGNLWGLQFLDAKHGFVAGDNGMVLVTDDGGDTWQRRAVPTPQPLRTLGFADGQRGLVGGGLGLLFFTRNGGRTWSRIDLHTRAAITALACFARSGLCLAGGERGLSVLGHPFRMPGG